MQTMKTRYYLAVIYLVVTVAGCKKSFLDVVPDNVATLDNAFTMRRETEKYLATCYSYLPNDGDPVRILLTSAAMNSGWLTPLPV